MPDHAHSSAPRDRILDAATVLLARQGFDAMTMRQLGDAVGLDNSSLYRHFRNKAALIHAAIDRACEETLTAIGDQLQEPPAPAAVETVTATLAGHLFDHPSNARLMIHWMMSMGIEDAGAGISVPVSDTGRPPGRLFHRLNEWLKAGIDAGTVRPSATSPEMLTALFGMMLLRPATYGYLLVSQEDGRERSAAKAAWIEEARMLARTAFGT